jgi:flagellar FliL protein
VSEGEGAVDGSKALDLIISTFSQANPADVNTARDALKEALQKKIVDAYTKDGTEMVMGIYYNQYVTQ